ncbi:DUF397 domain-containing protein [Streptomyces sp. NPDC058459]|uniref:DUF397 domain-containing protein n=1 Tax=Streptomyces sp. NPDC058459 TaxID=3346508 RepID=UPI00364A8B12
MNRVGGVWEPSELVWRKSTYSSGEGGECVEVATRAAAVHVRDSKCPPRGRSMLTLTSAAWAEFLARL